MHHNYPALGLMLMIMMIIVLATGTVVYLAQDLTATYQKLIVTLWLAAVILICRRIPLKRWVEALPQ